MTTVPDDVIEAMVVSYYDQPGDDTEAGWHIEAMRAALAAAEAKGWKLVPREPTGAMLKAGFGQNSFTHPGCPNVPRQPVVPFPGMDAGHEAIEAWNVENDRAAYCRIARVTHDPMPAYRAMYDAAPKVKP